MTETRMRLGFGTFVILIYALYGAYITSLFILVDDKGGLRSADFLFFVIFFLLLGLSNFGKLLIIKTTKNGENSLILLFIFYMLLKTIIEDDETNYFIKLLFTDIGQNFIAGFISFSVVKSRMPIISKIIAWPQSTDGIRRVQIISSVIFILTLLYFLSQLLKTSIFNIFQIKSFSNNYYQDFGDDITIAYCCLISLQISYLNRNRYSIKNYNIFVLLVSTQAVLSFMCLQVATSNKSVLVIALVSVLALYVCKPKDWLFVRGRMKKNAFFLIPIYLFLIWLLLYRFIPILDVSQLRIYDYGESSSIVENSSLRVRLDQAMSSGVEDALNAPVFGSLSNVGQHNLLLSVQNTFGLIGSLLFWSFMLIQLRQVYRHVGNEGLKVIALPILSVAVISSGFSWPPVWFLIGALYQYTPRSPETGCAVRLTKSTKQPQISS